MCSTGPFGSFLASTEIKCPNRSADRTGIAKTIPLSYLKAIVKLPSLQLSSESSDQRHTSKRIKQNSKKQEQIPSEENLAHHVHHAPLLTHLTQRMQLFLVWCCGGHTVYKLVYKPAIWDVLVTLGWLNHQKIYKKNVKSCFRLMLRNCIWQRSPLGL